MAFGRRSNLAGGFGHSGLRYRRKRAARTGQAPEFICQPSLHQHTHTPAHARAHTIYLRSGVIVGGRGNSVSVRAH